MVELGPLQTHELLIAPVNRQSKEAIQSPAWVAETLRRIAPTASVQTVPDTGTIVATVPTFMTAESVQSALGENFLVSINQRLQF
jgi:hypothetical protein